MARPRFENMTAAFKSDHVYSATMAEAHGAPHPGRLIVLEGIDGSGKSTVAQRLAEALDPGDSSFKLTREPTGSTVGQALREVLSDPDHDPVSEALLFAADHADHVARLRRDLDAGRTVLSDRYSFSCLAYQGATLAQRWPQRDPVTWLEAVLAPFELEPDLVLLLDLPVEAALARVTDRVRENEKFEEDAFLRQVRENYRRLADERGFEIIDASGSPEATVEACQAAIAKRFGEGAS